MSNVPEAKQVTEIKREAAKALDYVMDAMRKYPNTVDTYVIFADVFGSAAELWKFAVEELTDKAFHRPEVLPDFIEEDAVDDGSDDSAY
jgi:hypothetical protein